MKRLLVVLGVILGVLIVAVLAVPLFINVDSFRPNLEKSLSASLNRQVKIGKLSASLLSGGASASDISISDDPAFNKGAFLKASSVNIGLKLMPLIFSHEVDVTGITVKQPDIVLLKNAAGKWNYSSLGSSNSNAKENSSDKSTPQISVEKFEIAGGKVRVGTSSRSGPKEQVYQNVNLTAKNISQTSVMPFTLTADTPAGGTLKLSGQAGPLNRQDSSRTPLDAQVSLEHADLAATGFVDPSSGLGGTLDFDGTVKSDGKMLHSEGRAKASKLKVVKGGNEAKAPVALDYKSDFNLESENGDLNANVHTGNSTVKANGTLNAKGESNIAHLKVQGKDMAVNDVEALLPAFGVVLPSGAALQGGNVNLDMTAEGPLDALVITGPLSVTGTHLTGFDLASKLGAVAALTGIKSSPDTLIQTFSSAMRVAPEGIRADNIVLDVPSIGSLTGNGTISSNNALAFKMLMKLSSNSGSLLGGLTSVSYALQNKGVPFLIEGTTQNPKFLPAIGNELKQNLGSSLLQTFQGKQSGQTNQTNPQQKQDLKGVLGGLLKRKSQ